MKVLKVIGIIWLASTVLGLLVLGIGALLPKNKDNRTASPGASPTATAAPVYTTTVTFDNGTRTAVKVRLDSKEVTTVPAFSFANSAAIPVGKHKVEVLGANGKAVDKQTIVIPETARYGNVIYNVARVNHYAVYTMGYGSAKVSSPRRPLPDKVLFVKEGGVGQLGDGFPSVVKVRKGTGGTTMSVLGHVPIHRDRKCCERLRASLKAS